MSVFLPSDRQVVDGDLAKVLLVVNDEQSSEGDARLLVEHAVVAGDAVGLVADDRDVHGAQASCNTKHFIVTSVIDTFSLSFVSSTRVVSDGAETSVKLVYTRPGGMMTR